MIQLQLLDRNGTELNIGDGVKVFCRAGSNRFNVFYTTVELIDGYLSPHDTFAWESLEKFDLDKLPVDVAGPKVSDAGYKYWYQLAQEEGSDTGQHLDYVSRLNLAQSKSFRIKMAGVVPATAGKVKKVQPELSF